PGERAIGILERDVALVVDVGLAGLGLVVDLRAVGHDGERAAGATLAALLEALAEHEDGGAGDVARGGGVDAWQLDDQAVGAGALDGGLGHAERIDAALDDLLGGVERLVDIDVLESPDIGLEDGARTALQVEPEDHALAVSGGVLIGGRRAGVAAAAGGVRRVAGQLQRADGAGDAAAGGPGDGVREIAVGLVGPDGVDRAGGDEEDQRHREPIPPPAHQPPFSSVSVRLLENLVCPAATRCWMADASAFTTTPLPKSMTICTGPDSGM